MSKRKPPANICERCLRDLDDHDLMTDGVVACPPPFVLKEAAG